MEYEINKLGPNSKMSMTNRLKQYKFDIDLIQKDLVREEKLEILNYYFFYIIFKFLEKSNK